MSSATLFITVLALATGGQAIGGLNFDTSQLLQLAGTQKRGSGFNPIIDLTYQNSEAVRHKLNLLTNVQDTMDTLFTNTAATATAAAAKTKLDPVAKEVFSQLRSRCLEKIVNLRFMLESVERMVNERNQLERMSEVFSSLATRRINESEELVSHIHRTAAELSDGIKVDLYRVVDTVERVAAPTTSLLGFGGSLASLLDRIDLTSLKKFKL